jgi:hypothetical protein
LDQVGSATSTLAWSHAAEYIVSMTTSLRERLYAKLPERPKGGCWIFAGAKNPAGYGKIYVRTEGLRTITTDTHRASWEVHRGLIPEGAQVLHRCDTPSCCNPAHLFLGSQADNMRDKSAKGRARPGPVSRSEWWTPERRAERAQRFAARNLARRQAAAASAGVGPDGKRCPGCDQWKTRDAFGYNAARHDGAPPYCRECRSERG